MSAFPHGASQALSSQRILRFLLLLTVVFLPTSRAVFINFENCLDSSFATLQPLRLQWVPLYLDARFDTSDPAYTLDITLYGNVNGQQFTGTYPSPNDSSWLNPNETFGKIANTGADGKQFTTQFVKYDFLTYNAYTAPASEFCASIINETCPLGPLFNANASDPGQLHKFSVAHDFRSSYSFSTIVPTIRVVSGDVPPADLACISANITPDLGSRYKNLITWLPAGILMVKGIATVAAAIYSPWGSSDIFRWSSNYGRDEDLLRLVTPGFGDCLQYIQFVFLTGSLSIQYPGFFQPAVSHTGWSSLMFNESFVTHGNGTQSLVDGIYIANGTYGMTRMSQLIGMTSPVDLWAGMAIWLLVIAGIIIVLCQLGFAARWIYQTFTRTTDEDLRSKNLPFTLGNMIRLLFNYFILPIVALSFFQLVVAAQSPIVVVVMAIVLIAIMILSAIWSLRIIFGTRPRTILFDDMPTVLLYGPLYNTYSDSAAPFALVPTFITFIRGVAIGAVQPSGIAQIILLAVCEVVLILTLNGLRPFQNQTSMNLYHTVFSSVRLITVLLSVAFLPSLGVEEAPKGWVGYVILILHACVLVFGFFLNATQTLLEVIARSFGVGGDARHGAVRGSILSGRMLKRRQTRPDTTDRNSMLSSAAILQDHDAYDNTRSRSMSTSSQQLLNQAARSVTPSTTRLSAFEMISNVDEIGASPNIESESTMYGYGGGRKRAASKKSTDIATATDNFYRPPRPRRGTNDALTLAGGKSRQSGTSSDFPYSDSPGRDGKRGESYDSSLYDDRDVVTAPTPFHDRNDSDDNTPRPDYAVREVDQYYRGAALSDTPTRKLKTGPTNPEGPAANAQSWLQRLVFGVQGRSKQKEPSKGFEVVRSTRMPPEVQRNVDEQEDFEMVNSPPMKDEPYQDSPPIQRPDTRTSVGAERDLAHDQAGASKGFNFGFDGAADPMTGTERSSGRGLGVVPDLTAHPALRPSTDTNRSVSHPGMRAEIPSNRTSRDYSKAPSNRSKQTAPDVPSLAPIQSVGGIDLPSRFASQRSSQQPFGSGEDEQEASQDWLRAVDDLNWGDHSRQASQRHDSESHDVPQVPARSSRRLLSDGSVTNRPDLEFPGFDSTVDSPSDHAFNDLERPTSFAVSHHRAADSITRNNIGAHHVARSAEVFGDESE